MIQENTSYKVKGYTNTWSVISSYRGFVLLENEVWGDETCYLVVRKNVKTPMKEYKKRNGEKIMLPTISAKTYETFDDIRTCLIDEDII